MEESVAGMQALSVAPGFGHAETLGALRQPAALSSSSRARRALSFKRIA